MATGAPRVASGEGEEGEEMLALRRGGRGSAFTRPVDLTEPHPPPPHTLPSPSSGRALTQSHRSIRPEEDMSSVPPSLELGSRDNYWHFKSRMHPLRKIPVGRVSPLPASVGQVSPLPASVGRVSPLPASVLSVKPPNCHSAHLPKTSQCTSPLDPVAHDNDPVAHDNNLVTSDDDPVAHNNDLVTDGDDPIAHDKDPVTHDNDPVAQDCGNDPVLHDVILDREPVLHGPAIQDQDSDPVARDDDTVGSDSGSRLQHSDSTALAGYPTTPCLNHSTAHQKLSSATSEGEGEGERSVDHRLSLLYPRALVEVAVDNKAETDSCLQDLKETLLRSGHFIEQLRQMADSGSSDPESDSETHPLPGLSPGWLLSHVRGAMAPAPTEVSTILLRKKGAPDFGFSVSDGLVEPGVFVKDLRPGGPADLSGQLKAFDRILKVCMWFKALLHRC